jgi:5-methylcytosine-specific restriction endonuclease McrA
MARPILLLNATYEPLAIVALQRAVLLVLDGKAEVVEATDALIRSPSTALPYPAVIRLVAYARVPWRGTIPLTRAALLARDNRTCQYCGKTGDTIDHVLPRARGGKHVWENVVIACVKCNGRKADKTLAELGWKLPRQPAAPRGVRWVTLAVGTVDPTWAPYIDRCAAA